MRSRYHLYGCFCLLLTVTSGKISFGQSLGNAGTVEGMVVDPSGSAVPKATITFRNAVSGYSQTDN
jgi:hypothetical protein